jgi:hypothetical protein
MAGVQQREFETRAFPCPAGEARQRRSKATSKCAPNELGATAKPPRKTLELPCRGNSATHYQRSPAPNGRRVHRDSASRILKGVAETYFEEGNFPTTPST